MKKFGISILVVVILLAGLVPYSINNKVNAMSEMDDFYYKLLNDKTTQFGIYGQNNVDYGDTGVVYVKFFDLNKNNIDDLFILTLENDSYVLEIYFDGELKITNTYSGPHSGLVGDSSIQVYISDNELMTRSESSYSRADDGYANAWKDMEWIGITSYKATGSNENYQFSLTNSGYDMSMIEEAVSEGFYDENSKNELLRKGVLSDGYVEITEYEINDNVVTKDQYDKTLNDLLKKEWISLVVGGLGTNEVAYKDSEQNVKKAYAHIQNKYIPTNIGANVMSSLDEAYLESMLSRISETIDYLSYSEYNLNEKLSTNELLSIVAGIAQYSPKIEFEGVPENIKNVFSDHVGLRIPVIELDEYLTLMVGQTIDTEYMSPDDIENQDEKEFYTKLWRKDGYYYFNDFPAYGAAHYIPIVKQIYRLDEHVYYISYDSMWPLDDEWNPRFGDASFVEINKQVASEEGDDSNGSFYSIMKSTVINGETVWTFLEAGRLGRLFTEEQIKSFNQQEPITRQVQLNIIDGDSMESFIKEINNEIQNIELNEVDYFYLRSRLISEYQKYTSLNVKAKRNTIEVSDEMLLLLNDQVNQMIQQITEGVKVSFNEMLPQVFRINISNLDYEKPIIVSFDQNWVETLSLVEANAWISISFDGAAKGILVKAIELKNFIEQYNQFRIEISYTDSAVTIQMFNDQTTIQQLPNSLQVLIPATTSNAIVSYNDYIWGGLYHSDHNSIMFIPKYPGTYSLETNSYDIDKYAELSDDHKKKLSYVMSRGLFLQGEQVFEPSLLMTRNEFVKNLVLLFFALDEQAKTTFTDVSEDSPYYMFIASGQKREIIKGFKDGTFGGELNVTIAQVLSLAGRSLADDKGYSYPENSEDYLQFIDVDLIANDMKSEIALAVQYGLFSQGGLLEPNRPITQIEAVEIFYRLSELLFDDSLYVAMDYTNEQDSAIVKFISENMLVVGGLTGGIVILAASACYFYIRRKRSVPVEQSA